MDLLRPEWGDSPDRLVLSAQEIHVWRAALTLEPRPLDLLTQLLSTDEVARSQRFRFPQHQRRFAAGRGILRTILGRYLNVAPDRLEFQYGPTGKPSLSTAIAVEGLFNVQFNLSHSQDLMLCAISRDRPLGIDLEQVRPLADLEALTDRCFAPAESRRICALPAMARSQAFLQYWTGKEAVLKAAGTGLAQLSEVALELVDGTLQPIGAIAQQFWTLQSFVPEDGFVGAIAVNRSGARSIQPQITFWQWLDSSLAQS